MPGWIVYVVVPAFLLLVSTGLFFFFATRGALLWRSASGSMRGTADHVYPIYSNMRLIRLVDFQPIIAAILLFQYDRLVSAIVAGIRHTPLAGKDVLITSCAFGNVMPRVVKASIKSGTRKVLVADIIKNELEHAQSKLQQFSSQMEYLTDDATAMKQADGSVAVNVIFFLLHELPHHLKEVALREAVRVLQPGGKLYLAEFHRPHSRVLRTMSWTYFKVFEPLGLALWNTHDPLKQLESMGGVTCERRTVFFGNFQVIVATKNLA
jgi:ubiquinone/menaquinone biosynthesis C-methylase UbiE